MSEVHRSRLISTIHRTSQRTPKVMIVASMVAEVYRVMRTTRTTYGERNMSEQRIRPQIRFVVSMDPHPKRRPVTGRDRRGRTVIYTDGKTVRWEQTFSLMAARHSPKEPFEGPIGIRLMFLLQRPGRLNKRSSPPEEQWHYVRPDLDNLVKSALDSLTIGGRFFRDDRQVAELVTSKLYHAKGARPEVGVTIYQLEEER